MLSDPFKLILNLILWTFFCHCIDSSLFHKYIIRSRTKCYLVLLSLLNFGMAAMMGALGMISLIELIVTVRFANISALFLSGYMVIFATLLFLYEFIWWQPIASINIMFRKNFGFLYGLRGKGFYLIFMAFLTLGLINDDETTISGLDWATGLGWLFAGLLHLFVACSVPGSNDLYKPPTVGLSTIGADGADFSASTTV
jgi:hypothetical protein